MANSIIGAIEEVAKALGINFPELPTPTAADAGKVLGVDAEGKYALITPETPDDSGTDDSGT